MQYPIEIVVVQSFVEEKKKLSFKIMYAYFCPLSS